MKQRTTIGERLYQRLKPFFLKYYYYELSKNIEHKDMTPIFVDDIGRTYYEFPEGLALPIERFAKEKEFIEWMTSGINNDNLRMLTEAAQELLMDALKSYKNEKEHAKKMAKVHAILQQIQMRYEQIVPIDLIINTICAVIVREDEDPCKFNEKIHKEKCDFFMEHKNDYGFFFQVSSFRRLSKLLNMQKSGWSILLKSWEDSQAVLKESLRIISSYKESSSDEKPMTSST